MKRALRAAFGALGRYGAMWRLFKLLNVAAMCLAEPLFQAERARRSASDAEFARALSPTLTVLHGPFAGMRYPAARAAGSALVPKILGSYERELHAVIERIVSTGYSDIVDVGCAEGWYAVGLAMRLPGARVHAFDTDADARALCIEMASANGVGDRVGVHGLCDGDTLLSLGLGPRALIVSDCEGYEAELFTPVVAGQLARHDLLIEVHDRDDPELGERLREHFRPTHDPVVVDSIDDTRKLRSYEFVELTSYPVATRRDALSEGRGMVMEWLFLVSHDRAAERRMAAGGVAVTA